MPRTTKTLRYGDCRLRAEPLDDGRWRVFEEARTPCEWRVVGHEVVETVDFDC
ncbi:hypothetical protein [Natronomonas marina]|uniref:hypothetical protein n=1 Tax=Natronomonas marina TaxID=2961939 RepID=UPI0020C9D3FF|nr:hypothetical protein [Natronomonas marina]